MDEKSAGSMEGAQPMSIALSDEFIETLFSNTSFGPNVDGSTQDKRAFIIKALQAQQEGFWSGNTIYTILVQAGFIIDAKTGGKELTAVGKAFYNNNKNKIITTEDQVLISELLPDAYDNAFSLLQTHDEGLGIATEKNKRTAEEYETQMERLKRLTEKWNDLLLKQSVKYRQLTEY